MKRKLIKYDVFESIQQNSLSASEVELIEASEILSKTIGTNSLSLVSFGKENATYESTDGNYINVQYEIKEGKVNFSNIEQWILDESSEIEKSKTIVSNLIDSLLESDPAKKALANDLFREFINLPRYKRNVNEAHKKHVKNDKNKKSNFFKMIMAKKADGGKECHEACDMNKDKKCAHKIKKNLKEWANLVGNVSRFVDHKKFGPILSETSIKLDEKGTVSALSMPISKSRNEAKLLSFNYKTLDTELKVLRGKAKNLAESNKFCKAVAEIKRNFAFSDESATVNSLESIVKDFPEVLGLTKSEMVNTIGDALQIAGVNDFDDDTCELLADGIQTTAFETYQGKADRIATAAGTKLEGDSDVALESFRIIVNKFYPKIDETSQLEMQAFVDLYEAMRNVYQIAGEAKDGKTQKITENHLTDLYAVINGETQPNIEIASNAVDWLKHIVETNLETEKWNPSNNVHISVNGDHPEMFKKADKGYTPSKDFTGNWGSPAPVSNGKDYSAKDADEMAGNSWGNVGGNEVWPSLSNPYVPKADVFTMKGEKGADKEDGNVYDDGENTWPKLQNPIVPKSEMPRINNGKEDDDVVGK